MRGDVKKYLDRFVAEFSALNIPCESHVLFGSQATGKATARSDVDVAVVMSRELTARERGALLNIGPCIDLGFDADLFFTNSEMLDNAGETLDTNYFIRKEGIRIWPV